MVARQFMYDHFNYDGTVDELATGAVTGTVLLAG